MVYSPFLQRQWEAPEDETWRGAPIPGAEGMVCRGGWLEDAAPPGLLR